jgi:hypothetical protein
MRDLFRGYYKPTQEEFDQLWSDGLVVLDANVLLNLYRYSTSARQDLIQVLTDYSDRLWLPFQAASEYQNNRLKVMFEQFETYKKFRKSAEEAKKDLTTFVERIPRHPTIDSNEIQTRIDDLFTSLTDYVTELESSQHGFTLDDASRADPLQDRLSALFQDKVGPALAPELHTATLADGVRRYAKKIPPGFLDADKSDEEKYGDLVLWTEIIERAKSTSKPVIFVTDDQKEDWWLRVNGRTIGPRPELVAEFWGAAHQLFYMYGTDRFIEMAKQRGHSQPSDETVNEIRDISDRLSRYRNAIAERSLMEHAATREILESGQQWALAKRLELASLGDQRLLREAQIGDLYDRLKSEADAQTRAELVEEKNRLVRELESIYLRLGKLASDDEETPSGSVLNLTLRSQTDESHRRTLEELSKWIRDINED